MKEDKYETIDWNTRALGCLATLFFIIIFLGIISQQYNVNGVYFIIVSVCLLIIGWIPSKWLFIDKD